MAAKMQDLNVNKLFKIAKLNLRGQAKEWFRKLNPTLVNGTELHSYNSKIWGCWCQWHSNEAWHHQIGTQEKGSKVFWTSW